MPNKIFVSYRREDSRYQARRIYDALQQNLPPGTVFMDIDSIPIGADFAEILEGWVQQCDVLLALIGPNWVDSTDMLTKQRRLDNPEDFVRIEIRGALDRKIPVVPVLIDSAQMPSPDQLPDDIRALLRRNAEFVEFRTFDADVQRLIKKLGNDAARGKWVRMPRIAAAGVGALAILAAVGLYQLTSTLISNSGSSDATRRPPQTTATALAADLGKSEEARRKAEATAAAAAADLAKSEEARRKAEATAAVAAADLAKSEEARRNAEATAGAAAADLARSEEARRRAEATAAAAAADLAKSEEARRKTEATAAAAAADLARSEEARRKAEATAAAAAADLTRSEEARRKAEATAAAAAADLAKSEEARQTAQRQLREIRVADVAAAPLSQSPPSPARRLVDDMGQKSRWAKGGVGYCGDRNQTFSLALTPASMTWLKDTGSLDIESIEFSGENEIRTKTQKSSSVPIGTIWTYSRDSNRIGVQRGGKYVFTLGRCS